MLLTRVVQVLLLPVVALLHSNEYGPRHLSEVAIGEVAPYVDLSAPLAYHCSHAGDYNARHVLGSIPSWLGLVGHWRVTNNDGTDSGGGVVRLWTSGRGEYVTRYTAWPLDWYVIDRRVLVLKYDDFGITELYSSRSPPTGTSSSGLRLSRANRHLHKVHYNCGGD